MSAFNKYAIGIDLGGTVIKIGLVAEERVLAIGTLPAESATGLAARLPAIDETIHGLLTQEGVHSSAFAGVGLSFPGLVDVSRGVALSTNAKYDDATTLDLSAWGHRFGGRFFMDNDARMAAAGEWRYGAGRGTDDMVMMTLGTGVGCGVIMRGKLVRGAHYQAGCLGGHLIADYRGRRCSCGNQGCIEAMASSFFLDRIVQEDSRISDDFYQRHRPFDFKKLFALAAAGDPEAIIVRDECMDVWSAGVINLIHAYDPETVVLGGGIMRSADVILPHIRRKVDELAWTPWGKVDIVSSELGDNAAILGVAYCVTHQSL